MAVDTPTIGTGGGAAVKWYSGDTDPAAGAPSSPPAGSLYIRRDPTASPGGLPAIYENYGTSATPDWRVLLGPAVFDVRRFGAKGASAATDTAGIQAAVAAAVTAGRGVVYLPPGTYTLNSAITIGGSDVALIGAGAGLTILRAASDQAFRAVIEATGRSRLLLRDFTVDVNGAARPAVTGGASGFPLDGIRLLTCTDCTLERVTVTGTRGCPTCTNPYPISALAVGVGDASVRCSAISCLAIDCGVSDTTSDGFYFAGDEHLITACRAVRCTDTAFVLENTNRSGIVGCIALDCGSPGAVTVGGDADKTGNFVVGLTARGALGGFVIGNVLGSGDLLATRVAHVTIHASSGGAIQPGINFRKLGTGRTVDCSLTDIDVDGTAVLGVTNGLLVDGADGLRVRDLRIRNTSEFPVQVNPGCTDVLLDRIDIATAEANGIVVYASTDVVVRDPVIEGAGGTPLPMNYGVLFIDACPGAAVVGADRIRNWRLSRVEIAGTGAIAPLVTLLLQGPIGATVGGWEFGRGAGTTVRRTSDAVGDLESSHDLRAPGGFRHEMDGWRQDPVPATQTDAVMTRDVPQFVAVRAGSVTGLAVAASTPRTGGSITLTVFKNGTATGAQATLSAGSTASATFAKDSVAFAAGDRLELRISSASWGPAGAAAWGTLEIET